jgi:diketogulonate reductase-like aldo/keto reductase
MLNTGAEMPAVGLGTWQSKPNEVQHAVEWALARGYRLIDTAAAYGNEKEVGQGIKASGVPRDQIWLTTKLNNPWHKRVPEAIDLSLKNLGTDYVDLYLMHWPCSTDPDTKKHYKDWNFIDTWREMQKLLATGKVRNIGVSNFGISNLEKLLADPSCKVRIARPGSRSTSPASVLTMCAIPDRACCQPGRDSPKQPIPEVNCPRLLQGHPHNRVLVAWQRRFTVIQE